MRPLIFLLLFICTDISALTLREKVAQLFIVAAYPDQQKAEREGFTGDAEQSVFHLVHHEGVGGVFFKYQWDRKRQIQLVNQLQDAASIPLLIAQDLEQGLGSRIRDELLFPSQRALGSIENRELLIQVGRAIGEEAKSVGVNFPLTPVLDINSQFENPIIHLRAFGDDPKTVAECGKYWIRGLQMSGLPACAKHFPGHGAVKSDSHTSLPVLDKDFAELEACEWVPFRLAIEEGVKTVMTAHLALPQVDTPSRPASQSPLLVQGVLRGALGFQGVVVTDDLIMQGAASKDAALNALKAGNDLLMLSFGVEEAIDRIVLAVEEGEISEKEIDEHLERVMRLKASLPPLSAPLCRWLYEEALEFRKGSRSDLQTGQLRDVYVIGRENCSELHPFFTPMQSGGQEVWIAVFPPARRSCAGEGIAVLKPTQEELAALLVPLNCLLERQRGMKRLVVWFGSPYFLPEHLDAECVVCAFDSHHLAQSALFNISKKCYNKSKALNQLCLDTIPTGTTIIEAVATAIGKGACTAGAGALSVRRCSFPP